MKDKVLKSLEKNTKGIEWCIVEDDKEKITLRGDYKLGVLYFALDKKMCKYNWYLKEYLPRIIAHKIGEKEFLKESNK